MKINHPKPRNKFRDPGHIKRIGRGMVEGEFKWIKLVKIMEQLDRRRRVALILRPDNLKRRFSINDSEACHSFGTFACF